MTWRDRLALLFGAATPFVIAVGGKALATPTEPTLEPDKPAVDRDQWTFTDPAQRQRYERLAGHSSHASHASHASGSGSDALPDTSYTPTPDSTPATTAPSAPAYRFTPSETADIIQQVQIALTARGYDTGPPDGVLTPKTKEALRLYQGASALTVTGFLDVETMRRLGLIN